MYYLSFEPSQNNRPIAISYDPDTNKNKAIVYLNYSDKKCEVCIEKKCDNCSTNECKGGCLYNNHIYVGADKLKPIPKIPKDPTKKDRECIYISGPSGSGKSTYAATYIRELKKMYPDKIFYIFSKLNDDEVLDKLNPVRIPLTQKLVENPIKPEELDNSICLFDDIDTIKDKAILKALYDLREDLMQTGRHENVYVVTTSHQLMEYKKTRNIISESMATTFFLNSGGDYHIRRFLTTYCSLNKEQINRLLNLKSRWVTVYTRAPNYVLSEHEVYLTTDKGDTKGGKSKVVVKEIQKEEKPQDKELDKAIKALQKNSLSSEDVLEICKGKANLLTYPQLAEYTDLDDALGPHKALILLYETKKNYGHWVCVFRRDKDTLEFFDPYGTVPDDELKDIDMNFRKVNNELKPHLLSLMAKTGNKIIYNNFKLQKLENDINTCGRWTGLRILLRDMTIEQFKDFIKQNPNYPPDFIATILTIF